MLTSLPATSSATASTTRARNSSESRGHRYGARPRSARSPSPSRSSGSGSPLTDERPTKRPPLGLMRAGSPADSHSPGSDWLLPSRGKGDADVAAQSPPDRQRHRDQHRAPEEWAVATEFGE